MVSRLAWNTLNPIQIGPGPKILNWVQYLLQACCQCMPLMSPHAGRHSVYLLWFLVQELVLWILHEGMSPVQGTVLYLSLSLSKKKKTSPGQLHSAALHSNLETWALSSELVASLNAGQCVRGVCIRNALRWRQVIGGALGHKMLIPNHKMDHLFVTLWFSIYQTITVIW
jgi:hypothetical protein